MIKRLKVFGFAVALTVLCLACALNISSAVELLTYPKFHASTSTGSPLAGGKLYTYAAGTDIAKATYSNIGLTSANANPVVLDARGEAIIYLSGSYKLVLKTSAGVTIWTLDNVTGNEVSDTNTYFADATQADQGIAGNGRTVYDIATAVGTSKKATVKFAHNSTGNTTTYTFATSLNLSSYPNLTFEIANGAILSPSSTKTLTVYSRANIMAQPGQQVFSGSGTVTWTKGTELDPCLWGFSISETAANNQTYLQAALTSLDNIGGTVQIDAGTFAFNSITVPRSVNLKGRGVDITILDARGATAGIRNTEAWEHQVFSDFTLTHANNVTGSGIDLIDADYGATSCNFRNLKLIGKNGVTTNGLRIRGYNSGGSANNSQYNNIIENLRTTSDAEITGKALYLHGQDISQARANGNYVLNCVLDGFTTGLWLNGNGNWIARNTFNGPCTGGSATYFYGNAVYGNTLLEPYFDSAITGARVTIESLGTLLHVVTIIEPVNEFLPSYIVNAGAAGSERHTILSKSHYFVAAAGAAGETNPADLSTNAGIFGSTANDLFHVAADPVATSGHLLLSGSAYSGNINAVSKNGGFSAVIADDADAEFRIVKTADGNTFTKLFTMKNSGTMRELQTTNGPVGTCTLDNGGGTTTVVNNSSVTANSLIFLFSTSANAAAAVGHASGVYISAKSAGANFTITHPASPGAGATMNYLVLN